MCLLIVKERNFEFSYGDVNFWTWYTAIFIDWAARFIAELGIESGASFSIVIMKLAGIIGVR